MSDLINKVVALAEHIHEGQFRHDGIEPYSNHPKRVWKMVEAHYLNPLPQNDYAITYDNEFDIVVGSTALLHDVLEDRMEVILDENRLIGLIINATKLPVNTVTLIVDLVRQLTNLDNLYIAPSEQKRAERKQLMCNRIMFMCEPAKIIKACDRLDNTSDMDSLGDFAQKYAMESITLFGMLLSHLNGKGRAGTVREMVLQRSHELSVKFSGESVASE